MPQLPGEKPPFADNRLEPRVSHVTGVHGLDWSNSAVGVLLLMPSVYRNVSVHLCTSTFPGRIVVQVEFHWAGQDRPDHYCRRVPYEDNLALVETIRQALDGRVFGGAWEEVPDD